MSKGSSLMIRSPLIGNRLRALREQMGLTQEEMAVRANVSRPAINQIEMGKGMNSVDSLARILGAYGVSWAFLDEACSHLWVTTCAICGERQS